MISKGLYDVLAIAIVNPDAPLRNATTDILNHITSHDASLFRKFLLSEKPQYEFIRLLINRYLNDSETGVMAQCGDIFKSLFDEECMGDVSLKTCSSNPKWRHDSNDVSLRLSKDEDETPSSSSPPLSKIIVTDRFRWHSQALEREEFASVFCKELLPALVAPLNLKTDVTDLGKSSFPYYSFSRPFPLLTLTIFSSPSLFKYYSCSTERCSEDQPNVGDALFLFATPQWSYSKVSLPKSHYREDHWLDDSQRTLLGFK
jgi:hypothetical protein